MKMKMNQRLLQLVVGFALILALVAFPLLNEQPSPRLKIILIAAVGLTLLAGFIVNARRRMADRVQGRFPDDEFTELARLSAGHAAFMMSMVLWLVIFAAQDLFDSRLGMARWIRLP